MGSLYFIEQNNWNNFLSKILGQFNIYTSLESIENPNYQLLDSKNLKGIFFAPYRLTQPLKSLIYISKEKVSETPQGIKKTIVLGCKACDLKATQILDKLFLEGDFIDPFYQAKRENTILISTDCTDAKDNCFCTLVGGNPFPEKGFDLNLSQLDDGYLVEVGSEKGKEIIEQFSGFFQAAEEKNNMRNENRQKVAQKISANNKEFTLDKTQQQIVVEKYDSPTWDKEAETCMGCMACTNICPSCNCFLLADTPSMRTKSWDSCQAPGFARVAGGANPHDKKFERFRNRYLCKFHHKKENFGVYSCTGCGRCVEACMGKIDMRKVLKELSRA